jgi:hypothetical protein
VQSPEFKPSPTKKGREGTREKEKKKRDRERKEGRKGEGKKRKERGFVFQTREI